MSLLLPFPCPQLVTRPCLAAGGEELDASEYWEAGAGETEGAVENT